MNNIDEQVMIKRSNPMGAASSSYLSLREIGRTLGIPPSSVVYYKDRFHQFIPQSGGAGRRVRYPGEALEIFKEIREMFNKSWSAEQIEQELAMKYQTLGRPVAESGSTVRDILATQGSAATLTEQTRLMDEIASALGKVSGMLENQALFRAEIDSLRAEVAALTRTKNAMERQYCQQLESLQSEVDILRREREDIMRRVLDEIHGPRGARNGSDRNERSAHAASGAPSQAFLGLPLVIRSKQGEYLGVAGKTRPFSLMELIRLVTDKNRAHKTVDLQWIQRGDVWTLRIETVEAATAERHEHQLEVLRVITPSRNEVAQVKAMVVDGNTVPDEFLFALFRTIKGEFED
ncbi:MAG: MerR family transcriptional regulator [Desulfovibrionaceae bacterium]